jgi:hypothetical protein
MPRKQRIDSISGAVMVAGDMRQIDPPADVALVEGAEPHFRRIIAAKANSLWRDESVVVAASYANELALAFRCQVMLSTMSDADFVARLGQDVRAAKHGALSIAKTLRQSLGLHDRGQNGEKRDSDKTDRIVREIEAGLTSGDNEHGLLN